MTKKIFFTILVFCLFLVGLIFIPEGKAQDGLQVNSVSPGTVSGAASTLISVQGNGFVEASLVTLEGFGELDSTFMSASTLTASVPAGVPAGNYVLRVTNPDGSWANLFNALTVLPGDVTPIQINPAQETTTPDAPSSSRPIVVIDSYKSNKDPILPGETFNLDIRLANRGREIATNVIIAFTSGDFIPQQTGGVLAIKELEPGDRDKVIQPFLATLNLAGQTVGTLPVTITYGDLFGNSFSESFTIAVNLKQYYTGVVLTPTPTPTAEPKPLPQLIITDYETDVQPLQPGSTFELRVQVANLGRAQALNTSMVVGGADISADPNATPGAGGISGGSGELSNFAPLGTSNVQFLGNIAPGETISAQQDLIVNVTTNPGAYPLKISFVYTISTGERLVDDQVVTLLVFSLPQLDVNFYQDPGPLFAGTPNLLPIQVVNLGKKSVVLGNMRVTSDQAECSNNVSLVGSLEAGNYFTLDASCLPFTAGLQTYTITIDYTDDFSQPQTVTRSIEVDILDQPPIDIPPEGYPGGENGEFPGGETPPEGGNETLWQKIVRFFRGLFGLDSAATTPEPPIEGLPPGEGPIILP
jgi:hypothetical protein